MAVKPFVDTNVWTLSLTDFSRYEPCNPADNGLDYSS